MFLSSAFLLNMFGGRMMFQDIQPYLYNKSYLKYLFIFCLFFIATKDINISLILIIIYIIFIQVMIDFNNIKDKNIINGEKGKEKKISDEEESKINNCIDILNEMKKS